MKEVLKSCKNRIKIMKADLIKIKMKNQIAASRFKGVNKVVRG